MAFAATTEWDVRVSGSDSNGGGFNTAATGTDRSQSDTAFQAYTDLVIGGTNTTITSAAHPFDATSPGNIINITGGAGFTVQRVQIVSVAGAVATCDKAVGTAASTGGTGNLGGAMLTLATSAALVVAGNTVHLKAGTYTQTAVTTLQAVAQSWIGYNATHRDGGTKPLITTATNSVTLFQISTGNLLWRNIAMSNTAVTRSSGINANGNYPTMNAIDSIFTGFTVCLDSSGGNFGTMSCVGCKFDGYTGTYAVYINLQGFVEGCWFNGGTNSGGWGVYSNNGLAISHCIFSNSAGSGANFVNGQSAGVFNCTFYALQQNGMYGGGNGKSIIVNNIFYQVATVSGAAINSGSMEGTQRLNAFGANGANRSGVAVYAIDDVTLTANPFTNPATGDFSLNSTAGGGALCKGAGFQWH